MNLLLVKRTITLKWNMLEYAVNLQQVSTCFLDKDLQFST